jgi:hypothetical protein
MVKPTPDNETRQMQVEEYRFHLAAGGDGQNKKGIQCVLPGSADGSRKNASARIR